VATRRRWAFLILAGVVILLDQASKEVMTVFLAPRRSVTVIPGLFDLTYVRNSGAVFGLFRDLTSPWRGLLLTLVPLVAVGVILALALRTPGERRRPLAALGLILGGAIGNLIDRVRFGSVVDFLDVYIGSLHWPAFNLADSAICIGVSLLLLDMASQPAGNDAPAGHDGPVLPSTARER
jgi:signal peptidase II